jgi:uncharacterized protein YidB (DUF937 family)
LGLLDSIMSAAGGQHPEVNAQQHASLLETAMQMFGNHAGLSGLVNNAESQGLGSVVSSWIGTGPNQSIAPDQVTGLVGQEQLQEIANRVGIPPAIASAALSRILPMIVDKVTPGGHLPQAG